MKYHQAKGLKKGDRVMFCCPDRKAEGEEYLWKGTVTERKGKHLATNTPGYVVIEWDAEGEPDDHTETIDSEQYFWDRIERLDP